MLIDEKGRLFGLINLIDFSVLLFIILIIPLIVMCYKFGNERNPKNIKREPVEVEMKFNVIPELAAVIKQGDINYDIWGKKRGEVIKIISTDKNPSMPDYTGTRILFLLMCDVGTNPPRFYGEELRVGTPSISFSTNLYSISGTVTSIRRLSNATK